MSLSEMDQKEHLQNVEERDAKVSFCCPEPLPTSSSFRSNPFRVCSFSEIPLALTCS